MSYRWAHPTEWLMEKTQGDEWNSPRTSQMIIRLLQLLDGDQIQDVCQEEMNADGYFAEEEV